AFTKIYCRRVQVLRTGADTARSRIFGRLPAMSKPTHPLKLRIRELNSVADLEPVVRLEKEVWGFSDADTTPLALAVATENAGSIWLGAFDGDDLIGFAFAFPSLHRHPATPTNSAAFEVGFHSHTLAVREPYRDSGIGYELKLAQRQKALGLGITEMTW